MQHTFEPLTFEVGLARFRTINTVEQAGRYLLTDWPEVPGPLHLRARQVCLQALQGELKPSKARDAFVAALEEAEIFVRH
jgi:hypothetical protein